MRKISLETSEKQGWKDDLRQWRSPLQLHRRWLETFKLKIWKNWKNWKNWTIENGKKYLEHWDRRTVGHHLIKSIHSYKEVFCSLIRLVRWFQLNLNAYLEFCNYFPCRNKTLRKKTNWLSMLNVNRINLKCVVKMIWNGDPRIHGLWWGNSLWAEDNLIGNSVHGQSQVVIGSTTK